MWCVRWYLRYPISGFHCENPETANDARLPFLCSDTEQLVDKPYLSDCVALCYSPRSPLPDHLHRFNSPEAFPRLLPPIHLPWRATSVVSRFCDPARRYYSSTCTVANGYVVGWCL